MSDQTPEPLTEDQLQMLLDYVTDGARPHEVEALVAEVRRARARVAELEAALVKANSAAGNLLGAAVSFAREADQPPTEPDAYIAVKRDPSPNAEGPEWHERATVIAVGDPFSVRPSFARAGYEFLPIVADGDGTRAVTAQADPVGYAVTVEDAVGRFIQFGAVLDRSEAERRARVYADRGGRVVELREVRGE